MQLLLVLLIVTLAALYSARQLLPAHWWQRLPKSGGHAPATRVTGPHAGCAGCPASSDCSVRRTHSAGNT